MKGTDQSASKPGVVIAFWAGRKPPLKLGFGQSPLTVTVVVLPKARIASRCAPENFITAVASNFEFGSAILAAGVPNKLSCVSPPPSSIDRLSRAAAGTKVWVLPATVMDASALAPRASEAPTRNSARSQSSNAPAGGCVGTPLRSNDALNVMSER